MSALSGPPPLYGVSLVAGTPGIPLAAFRVIVILGRAVRFGAICLAP